MIFVAKAAKNGKRNERRKINRTMSPNFGSDKLIKKCLQYSK